LCYARSSKTWIEGWNQNDRNKHWFGITRKSGHPFQNEIFRKTHWLCLRIIFALTGWKGPVLWVE
jgi:hypothetical protein